MPTRRRSTTAWRGPSYLRYALLLTSTGRGRFRITARGQTVLASPPQQIGIPYLLQFAEFKAFRERAGKETTPALSVVGVESDQAAQETALRTDWVGPLLPHSVK
jgi:restriction endonuclease Mrr